MAAGPAWTANWLWAMPIIALTLTMHAFGIAVIAQVLDRVGGMLARRSSGPRGDALAGTALLGAVGCVLTLVHGMEAMVWAFAYLALGALDTLADAMLYSLDSLTTRGESNIELQTHWRLLGALEATNGVLLFGISTAFLFAVIEQAWRLLHPGRHVHGGSAGARGRRSEGKLPDGA